MSRILFKIRLFFGLIFSFFGVGERLPGKRKINRGLLATGRVRNNAVIGRRTSPVVAATTSSQEVSAPNAFGAMSPNGARERLAARAPRTLPATGASQLRPAESLRFQLH